MEITEQCLHVYLVQIEGVGAFPFLHLSRLPLTKSEVNFNYPDLIFFIHALSGIAYHEEERKQAKADTKIIYPLLVFTFSIFLTKVISSGQKPFDPNKNILGWILKK